MIIQCIVWGRIASMFDHLHNYCYFVTDKETNRERCDETSNKPSPIRKTYKAKSMWNQKGGLQFCNVPIPKYILLVQKKSPVLCKFKKYLYNIQYNSFKLSQLVRQQNNLFNYCISLLKKDWTNDLWQIEISKKHAIDGQIGMICFY